MRDGCGSVLSTGQEQGTCPGHYASASHLKDLQAKLSGIFKSETLAPLLTHRETSMWIIHHSQDRRSNGKIKEEGREDLVHSMEDP